MPMLPSPVLPLLVVALLAIVFFDLIALSFNRMGIPPWTTILIFVVSYLGSTVNIPLWQSVRVVEPGRRIPLPHVIFYVPPRITDQVVAINVGGAVIPLLVCLWLLPRAPFLRTVLATAIVAVVSHLAATIVPGRGVEMPIWIAPASAALLGLLLTFGRGAAPLAYIAGTLGALIGADITNLGALSQLGDGVLSIGGAGVFDGVFLAGIVATLLSFERPQRPRYTRPIAT